MKKMYLALAVFLLIFQANSQNLYDESTIQTIEIVFSQSNWDELLDNAEPTDEYVEAQSVTINGTVFNSVGVKYKGNSSYKPTQTKNPFHIELDTYVNQDYQGYTDIKLNNVVYDPTFVRETLSYNIVRQYMHAPLANYAKVYVNGTYIGLYTNVESISKKFVNNHFGSNTNAFFDCSPPAGAGPTTTNLPNLAYLGTNSASYTSAYDMKSDTGWDDLIALTNTLSNNTANIETVLDVDRALWMLAFDNILVNLDSYLGRFKQNYYLYKDDFGRFNPIVWDLNMSFGVFSDVGTSNLTSTTQKKQLSPTLHSADAAWPLVVKLLGVPTYKKKYLAHCKTIINENFANTSYSTKAQAYQTLINDAVSSDVNKFYTTTQFTTNLNSDITQGMQSIPGITNLMNGRKTYLLALSDFTATEPSITAVTTSQTNPVVGNTFTITANITNTNASAVYLGYRTNPLAPFTKVTMYDDGTHNDGASGDNVYGANVTMSHVFMQYYIYAENNTIGKFSPERAEHEFYTVNGTYPTIAPGDLVINEIMAQNTSTVTDADAEYEDWFELYNNSNNTLSLDNLYATDTSTNLLKWQFPSGLTMQPHSYLIVWADEDLTQTGIHADFKFSASGESCILSYADGTMVDNVTFGAQTANMGYARNPNGIGNFVIQAPTFNANNETALGTQQFNLQPFTIYPNPATQSITILSNTLTDKPIVIYNQLGQSVYQSTLQNNMTINTSSFASGIYFVKCEQEVKKLIIK